MINMMGNQMLGQVNAAMQAPNAQPAAGQGAPVMYNYQPGQ